MTMEREEMREAATPSTPRGEMFQEVRGVKGGGGRKGDVRGEGRQ